MNRRFFLELFGMTAAAAVLDPVHRVYSFPSKIVIPQRRVMLHMLPLRYVDAQDTIYQELVAASFCPSIFDKFSKPGVLYGGSEIRFPFSYGQVTNIRSCRDETS